jgi:ABC-type nitrate/sulfonate/bicarbonate transport system permease component
MNAATVATAPALAASEPARQADGTARRRLLTAAGVVAVLAIWELVARTVLDGSYVLSAPSAIVARIADERTLYRRNLQFTTWNAVQGFVWGNLVAIAFAVVAVVAPITRRVVSAVALTVFCLPLVALAPILRVVLGPGTAVPVALAGLAVFFTTLVAALVGLRSAPTGPLELVSSYGRGRMTALVKVRARAAVPALVAGLQVAAPAAFLGALIGEFAGAEKGFGVLTIGALRTLETDRVWSVAVASTAVSCGAYVVIGIIGRRLCPWAPEVSLSARLADVGASRRAVNGLGGIAASLVVVVVLWVGFLRAFEVDSFFAKGPLDVWSYLVTEPAAAAQRSEVLGALGETLRATVLGFTAGMVAAIALATLFVSSAVVERVLTPVAVALRAVPIVATTPLIIMALGRGVIGTTAIVAVMSFFPTLVNVVAGMRQTPGRLLDVVRSYDAPAWAVLWKAQLPSALPAILASARIAVPASLLGATVAEWLATGGGMGDLMIVSASLARYDVLWSCVAVLTLTAVVGYGLVAALEGAVLRRYAPEHAT